MEIKNKKINIEDIKVIQAPLAGISDVVFRGLIRKHNSKCLMTTEMISVKDLSEKIGKPAVQIIKQLFEKKEEEFNNGK